MAESQSSEDSTVRRQPGKRRSKTLDRRTMKEDAARAKRDNSVPVIEKYKRPKTRGECENGQRPCLYTACRYHLYHDVNPETGSIQFNFPHIEPREMENSCAVDVAEKGGATLEEIGDILNLTRERIRQIETMALAEVQEKMTEDI